MGDLRYERPGNLTDALRLLASEPARALVLAGGTDLLAERKAGRAFSLLIDLKGIEALQQMSWGPGEQLKIGACATVSCIAADERIQKVFPALASAAGGIGSLQIRNRATIGGNICNASPCADTAPPLLVLGTRVQVADETQIREIPIEDFFAGTKVTDLGPGEILTAIIIPAPADGARSAFAKIKRIRGHDLALVNAAASFDPGSGRIRLALGSVAPTPVLIPGCDEVFALTADPEEVGQKLAAAALAHIQPIDDVRASAEYRRDMTAHLCRRLAGMLFEATTGQQGGR